MKKIMKYMLVLGVLVMIGAMGIVSGAQARMYLPRQAPMVTSDSVCSSDVMVADESPSSNPRVPLEKIIGGTVVEINEDYVVADSSAHGLVTLYISPETRIWKGKWDSDLPIEVGNFFYGYGEPKENGTVYEMEQMEVNIVSLRGGVLNVEKTSEGLDVQLDESREGRAYLIRITSETLISKPGREDVPFGETSLDLQPGDGVQIIGLQLKDGSVVATRVF